MKKYLLICTLSVAAIFTSCSDQLDRFPVDSLVEETAYNTVSDLRFGLNGIIGTHDNDYIIGFNSIFTDESRIGVDTGGQDLTYYQQVLNSASPSFSFQGQVLWNDRYENINNMNRLIVAAGGITPGPTEVDEYNNILAQTYAFRALSHYDLLLYYGLDFTIESALGVPYVDYVSADATPARNTTGEVLAGIEADLQQALALFPAGTNDINFATPDFVTFLRARIALESGNNAAAIGFCNSLIANYDLANTTQYFDMFNEDANKQEVIFNYDNVQGADSGINFIWNFSGQGPKFEISTGLFASLEADDIRRTVMLDPVSVVEDDLLIVGKYPINADTQAINDFKAMRISEIYLIRAEAYAKSSQFGLSAADVFAIQDARRASTPDPVAYSSLTEAIDVIIAERRIELAFEGHRYTDLKRVRSITGSGIVRDPADCGGANPCELVPTSNKWILPIVQGEINANPAIADQQAPGY